VGLTLLLCLKCAPLFLWLIVQMSSSHCISHVPTSSLLASPFVPPGFTFSRPVLNFLFLYGGWVWDLNLGLHACKVGALPPESASSPFCSGYFGVGDLSTICLSWAWTVVYPISASQVARVVGMSHQCLAFEFPFFFFFFICCACWVGVHCDIF
jgi:hypothetical protein